MPATRGATTTPSDPSSSYHHLDMDDDSLTLDPQSTLFHPPITTTSDASGAGSSAAAAGPSSGAEPKIDHRKKRRNRTTQSCLSCHQNKRKCDRGRPCGRCITLGLTGFCVYEVGERTREKDGDQVTNLRARVAELEGVVRELKNKPQPRWAQAVLETHNPSANGAGANGASSSSSVSNPTSSSASASNPTSTSAADAAPQPPPGKQFIPGTNFVMGEHPTSPSGRPLEVEEIIDMLPDSDPRELLASVTGSAVKFQFPKESWHVRSARKDKAAAAAAAAQQQQQQGQQQYPAPNQTIGPTSAVHDPSRDREAERNATHAVHTSLNAAMDRENSIDFGTPGAAGGGGGGTTFGVAPFSYANAGGSWKAGSGAGGGGAPPRGKQAEYNYDYDANGNAMGPPATSPSPFGNASSFAQQQQQQQQGMGAGLRRPSTGLGFANVNTTNANANGRNTGMPPPPSPTTANNSTTTLSSAAAHPPIHQGLIGSGVSGLSNPNAGRQRSLTGPPPAISARAGFHGALHHHHPHHLHHQHQPHQPSGLSRGSTFPPTPSSAPANGGFATPAPPSSANNGNGNASGVPSLNLSFVHPPPSRKVIAPGSVSSSSSSSSTASSSGRKSPSTTSLLASPFKSGGANVNGHSHSHSSGSFAPCACLHTSSPSSAPGSPSEQGTGAEGSSELVTVGAATGGGESGAEAFVANLLANIRDVTAFLEGLHPLSMGNLSLEEKDEGGADGEEGGAGAGVASSGSSRGVEENGRRYPVGVKGVGDCSVVRCLNQLDRAIRQSHAGTRRLPPSPVGTGPTGVAAANSPISPVTPITPAPVSNGTPSSIGPHRNARGSARPAGSSRAVSYAGTASAPSAQQQQQQQQAMSTPRQTYATAQPQHLPQRRPSFNSQQSQSQLSIPPPLTPPAHLGYLSPAHSDSALLGAGAGPAMSDYDFAASLAAAAHQHQQQHEDVGGMELEADGTNGTGEMGMEMEMDMLERRQQALMEELQANQAREREETRRRLMSSASNSGASISHPTPVTALPIPPTMEVDWDQQHGDGSEEEVASPVQMLSDEALDALRAASSGGSSAPSPASSAHGHRLASVSYERRSSHPSPGSLSVPMGRSPAAGSPLSHSHSGATHGSGSLSLPASRRGSAHSVASSVHGHHQLQQQRMSVAEEVYAFSSAFEEQPAEHQQQQSGYEGGAADFGVIGEYDVHASSSSIDAYGAGGEESYGLQGDELDYVPHELDQEHDQQHHVGEMDSTYETFFAAEDGGYYS